MVINDPKGELLVKFYVRGTVRGLNIIQFNLINAMKTDIYNPLGLAAESAREGDFTKTAAYVENIANVFFPLDGGDDPVWPNAANNAFKRAAYGLIDYYLEEEKELRLFAEKTGMDAKVLEAKVDEMWGRVTLYNTYQLFVQLTSKKLKNPAVEFNKRAKAGEFNNISDERYEEMRLAVEEQAKLWEDKPEQDLLSLYFNATDVLPRNSMRTLVSNANNSLKSMGGAEKMLASVYGIAVTAMSFFADPTISTLTSGTPSQNVDFAGISFPRCLGVRFHPDFLKMYHLIGLQAKWDAYEDKKFEKPLGKDFEHEDFITREGWARYYFKGKFASEIAYVRLRIINPSTGMLVRTFYFKFTKAYQMSLDASYYMTDPILHEKIVKNGTMTELRQAKTKTGEIRYVPAKTTFKTVKVIAKDDERCERRRVEIPAITRMRTRYSEKPRMIFLITPPHLLKYAKLLLIMIRQLVDLNFEQSYMTKGNQRPLLKTRFMLDELGNLQSDGHGIEGFQQMLSIGLGQDQQFTLILQTLQQLRDVYGDSVDKIIQGNTSNIVFLKSTDDSMLDTLQKMSGITHKTFIEQKSVTRDLQRLLMPNEGKVTYTSTTKEVPVISYNDMAFISERNSIVFRAGDAPIWNRNETILPMSWRLFKDTIPHPGHEYTLQTIPTLSSAVDFDVRANQPDFRRMLDKRMHQAYESMKAQALYKETCGYDDYQMTKLDQDVLADDLMELINYLAKQTAQREAGEEPEDDDEDSFYEYGSQTWDAAEDNPEQAAAIAEAEKKYSRSKERNFAKGTLSEWHLISEDGRPSHSYDKQIIAAYVNVRGAMEQDTDFFRYHNGTLYGVDGVPYIKAADGSADLKALNEAAKDPKSKVFAESDVKADELKAFGSYEVTDDFIRMLAAQTRWDFAGGAFDEEMYRQMVKDE